MPPCEWELPDPRAGSRTGPLAVGADLAPSTLITAYGRGLFPMPVGRRRIGWWSPDPRGVLPLDALRVSRSLRRSQTRYRVTVDRAFREVMVACATVSRPHGWITGEFVDAYERLHALGVAHSVETWSTDDELVGGLYGVSIGGFFAGESMFHRAVDASKVALMRLVAELGQVGDGALLDIQWTTEHLRSLGAVDLQRDRYLGLIGPAMDCPAPSWD